METPMLLIAFNTPPHRPMAHRAHGFGLLQRVFRQLGVPGSQMLEPRGQHAYEQPTILRQRRGQLTGSSVAAKPYSTFESTLLKLFPTATKTSYDKTWNAVFSKYNSLTAKEFSELTGMPRNESEKYLDDLTAKGQLEKLTTKNGAMWTLKNTSR